MRRKLDKELIKENVKSWRSCLKKEKDTRVYRKVIKTIENPKL